MDEGETLRRPSPEIGEVSAETAPRRRRRSAMIIVLALFLLAFGAYFAASRWWQRPPESAGPGPTAGPASYRSPGDAAAQRQIEALKNEALGVVQRLLDEYPQSPDALCIFGLVHNRYGDRAEAVRCWQQCLAICPGHPDACQSLGLDAFQGGQWEEAVQWLRQALETDPNIPEALLLLGKALSYSGRLEQALEALGRHLELAPESVEGWFRLGQAYLQLERYEEARKCHQAVLRLDPDCRPACYALAMACDRLGRKGEAELYRRAFADRDAQDRFPREGRRHSYDDLGQIRESLANAYVAAGEVHAAHGNDAKAEAHWCKAVDACPDKTEARSVLLSLYEGQGRLEDALRILDALRHVDPQNVVYHLKAGAINVQLMRLDAAEGAFGKVTELAPERPEGYVALAQLYLRGDGDRSRAQEAARTAVRLAPTAPNYFLLGVVCDRCGDVPGALTAMKRAMELDPGAPQYRDAFAAVQAKRATENNASEKKDDGT